MLTIASPGYILFRYSLNKYRITILTINIRACKKKTLPTFSSYQSPSKSFLHIYISDDIPFTYKKLTLPDNVLKPDWLNRKILF